MMTRLYRAAADRCADLIATSPSLEPAFVKAGAHVLVSARGRQVLSKRRAQSRRAHPDRPARRIER